ncbi:MAG: HlyD family efflux transporter periplasmic adaptor subunit [Deltaproteobacteria bacterium]|nr:HlyD family efflux transporter periplasmic adaptor subunit [Deltaproteobacteria bacterium]
MAVERPLARDDLIISPRVIAGETSYFICDPIKNEYKQLDEMQHEVFTRLDGKRTLPELADELKKTFDLDVSAEDLGQFIDNLQDMNLLDLAADTRVDAKAGLAIAAKVKATIERDGVVFGRRSGHGSPGATGSMRVERRGREAEAALFDRALEHIDRGRIREAAAQLRAVLAVSPRNYRARYLLHALLSEHLGGRTNVDSAWWWRIPIVNPDRVLGRLDRAIGGLVFTRVFLAMWFLLVGGSVLLVAADFDRLVANLGSFLAFDWIGEEPIFPLVFWTVGPLSILGHEMAHGLACKHFGGKVREMGILIAYLNPTAYCDISSTYLIQDRWQRALVSLAGPMFSYIVWSIWVLLWVVSNPDTLVSRLATIYVPIIGYSYVLQVVNPLMKNDGYYALTDLLNAPNLRDDAFTYLRLRLSRMLFGAHIEIPEELAARRHLFLIYAIPSITGTVFFNAIVLALIVSYVIGRFHSLGVLFSAFLLWATLGRPARRLLEDAWRSRKILWSARRFRRVFVAALAGVVLVLLAPWQLTIDADARVGAALEHVRARQTGAIAEVLVDDGEAVTAGQPLVRMASAAATAELAAADAALVQAELDVAATQEGKRDEELDVARARLYGDSSLLQRTNARLARLRALVDKGVVSRRELDEVEAARAKTLTNLAAAQGDLAAAAAIGNALEVEAAQAVAAGLRALRAAAQRQLDEAVLRSPVDGIVTLPRGASRATMVGSFVEAGGDVVSVRTVTAVRLELAVPIHEPVSGLVVGARVRARLVGMPDERLMGTVTKVSPAASADATMHAEVELDEGAVDRQRLPLGLTGKVRVLAGWHPVAWHLYLRAVRLIEIDLARLLS